MLLMAIAIIILSLTQLITVKLLLFKKLPLLVQKLKLCPKWQLNRNN